MNKVEFISHFLNSAFKNSLNLKEQIDVEVFSKTVHFLIQNSCVFKLNGIVFKNKRLINSVFPNFVKF